MLCGAPQWGHQTEILKALSRRRVVSFVRIVVRTARPLSGHLHVSTPSSWSIDATTIRIRQLEATIGAGSAGTRCEIYPRYSQAMSLPRKAKSQGTRRIRQVGSWGGGAAAAGPRLQSTFGAIGAAARIQNNSGPPQGPLRA